MKHLFLLLLFFYATLLLAQEKNGGINKSDNKERIAKIPDSIATIDMYRVITLQNDTTYIDTSLTIQKEYSFNYLRRDIFGLLPFANEGQTYTTLNYEPNNVSPYPEFGFTAKHFNFLEANDINYYSVATPLTELYFKTVMQQGQNLDAFITLNTSKQFNFSIAYKGLRSLGRYVNQLSSTGNFRFTTNYNAKNGRYFLKAHFTAQDIRNQENGGIVNTANFEDKLPEFENKARLQVYLTDAESLLDGSRYFLDHIYVVKKGKDNQWDINHQFNYEYKFFEFTQPTLTTTVLDGVGADTFLRFGNAYTASDINNKTRYNKLYNKAGVTYTNSTLGQFNFFAENFRYNYYYNSVLVLNTGTIPSSISDKINSIGAQYKYQKNNWNGSFLYSNAISDHALTNLEAQIKYTFNDENEVSFQYQKINKLPNHIYTLYQSSYVNYNWYRPDFKSEKFNTITVNANTQWANASFEYSILNDRLYFTDTNTTTNKNILLVQPRQYDQTINYLALKLAKEITFGKFALDNTVLYQNVRQNSNILNVPQIVTRNTLYYSDHVFRRAMFIQTGFIFNYFTKYNADNYNPLLGEFYVQTDKKIGAFPMVDFFINARVRQTRIYLKAEHFNSSFTGNNYYSAPNDPYRDFVVRFGLVWNFFK
ncbi:MAG TPA: putative porin [Flavobacterium sp.]|jgi:hypothetical protein